MKSTTCRVLPASASFSFSIIFALSIDSMISLSVKVENLALNALFSLLPQAYFRILCPIVSPSRSKSQLFMKKRAFLDKLSIILILVSDLFILFFWEFGTH